VVSMKRARTPTAGVEAGALPFAMPSRLVTPLAPGVPIKISVPKLVAAEAKKYAGRVLMKKAEELNGCVGVAVKRDQRSVTVSMLLAIAAVVPLAAMKALT